MTYSNRAAICALSIASLLLSGCATINPYRGPGDGTFDARAATDANYHGRLYASQRVAERLAEAYRKAVVEAASIKNGMAVGLPMLNAGALFGAATGQSRNSNFVPAVGFGTAGLLAGGALVSSPPRQAIYTNGRQALACAVAKSEPYLVMEADYQRFLSGTGKSPTDLGAALAAARGAHAELTGMIGVVADDGGNRQLTRGEKEVLAARSAALSAAGYAEDMFINAEEVARELAKLRGRVDLAPSVLDEEVRQISVGVDRQIHRTEVTFDAIRGALTTANLSPPVAPTTATAPPAAQSGGGDPGAGLAAGTQRLHASVAELQRELAAASAFLQMMQEREARVQDKTCQLSTQAALSVAPPSPATLAPGQTIVFSVYALGGAPSAGVAGGEGVSKEVVADGGDDYRVRVTADASAAPGPRVLAVRSKDRLEEQRVTFTVTAAAGAAPAVAPPPPAGGGALLPPPPAMPPPLPAPVAAAPAASTSNPLRASTKGGRAARFVPRTGGVPVYGAP